MKALISFVVDFVVSFYFKWRTANRDEQIGVIETVNKQNAEALKDAKIAKNVSDIVDNVPDGKLISLSDKLNSRH